MSRVHNFKANSLNIKHVHINWDMIGLKTQIKLFLIYYLLFATTSSILFTARVLLQVLWSQLSDFCHRGD